MTTKVFLFIAIQLFVVNILVAQNLKESLGGTKTNFQIFSDTVDLKVSDQIIILKAERNHYTDSSFGTGWGYGYQSFHLEFITKKNIKVETFKFRAGRDNGDKFDLIFYDADKNILGTTTIPSGDVDLFNNPSVVGSPFFYSIDLIDVPIVLLDKTAKIGMIKRVADK